MLHLFVNSFPHSCFIEIIKNSTSGSRKLQKYVIVPPPATIFVYKLHRLTNTRIKIDLDKN